PTPDELTPLHHYIRLDSVPCLEPPFLSGEHLAQDGNRPALRGYEMLPLCCRAAILSRGCAAGDSRHRFLGRLVLLLWRDRMWSLPRARRRH
ncbi:MAG: hypothetical protein M3025_04645, partial [Actinomycetota bacterium]|nr:hypothetical protein [Actinomycetota bacterium]